MALLHRNLLIAALAAAPLAILPLVVEAHVTGADPRFTAAPGDDRNACTACHGGTALNGGKGSVQIKLPGGNTYTPGVTQHISVVISDPAQRRWGFELSARLASNAANGQAGDLASTDSFTQVVCDDGRLKPCASPSVVQFITHTINGTRNGTTGSVAFEFDWTPPSTDLGKITLYAAGNAANGNNANTGDHIYTTSVDLDPAPVVPKPSIAADTGVVNAANPQGGIAPNSWITITGANLSSTTRAWTTDEIASGSLPASLDNVSVTIDGKLAFVEYVSPTQINVLTPADDAQGPVEVRVTSNGQTSDATVVNLQPLAPALFTIDGKYLATSTGDNSLLDKSSSFFAASNGPATVKPGDTIVLYGTGFGPTDPANADSITTPFTVTIGGVQATVLSAGLAPGLSRIYQLSVQVPDVVDNGDQPVAVQMGGVNSPAGAFVSVQR